MHRRLSSPLGVSSLLLYGKSDYMDSIQQVSSKYCQASPRLQIEIVFDFHTRLSSSVEAIVIFLEHFLKKEDEEELLYVLELLKPFQTQVFMFVNDFKQVLDWCDGNPLRQSMVMFFQNKIIKNDNKEEAKVLRYIFTSTKHVAEKNNLGEMINNSEYKLTCKKKAVAKTCFLKQVEKDEMQAKKFNAKFSCFLQPAVLQNNENQAP